MSRGHGLGLAEDDCRVILVAFSRVILGFGISGGGEQERNSYVNYEHEQQRQMQLSECDCTQRFQAPDRSTVILITLAIVSVPELL